MISVTQEGEALPFCYLNPINFNPMNENWYAVYTKPRWEKKVADLLSLHSIQNYCPLNRVLRQWSDRKKVVYEPLFSSYVFVKVTEKQLPALKRLDGILHYITWQGKPATIRESEITIIRHFLREYSDVKIKAADLNINDPVRVTSGPLMEQRGTVVAVKNQTVKVALPSLSCLLYVELAKTSLEPVAA